MNKREAKTIAIRCIVPYIHSLIGEGFNAALVDEYGYSQKEADKIVEQMEEIADKLQERGEKMDGEFNSYNGNKENTEF